MTQRPCAKPVLPRAQCHQPSLQQAHDDAWAKREQRFPSWATLLTCDSVCSRNGEQCSFSPSLTVPSTSLSCAPAGSSSAHTFLSSRGAFLVLPSALQCVHGSSSAPAAAATHLPASKPASDTSSNSMHTSSCSNVLTASRAGQRRLGLLLRHNSLHHRCHQRLPHHRLCCLQFSSDD